jgi:hypothetical protein
VNQLQLVISFSFHKNTSEVFLIISNRSVHKLKPLKQEPTILFFLSAFFQPLNPHLKQVLHLSQCEFVRETSVREHVLQCTLSVSKHGEGMEFEDFQLPVPTFRLVKKIVAGLLMEKLTEGLNFGRFMR